MSEKISHLTPLLPSPAYALTYALPLLVSSIVLAFAGTFLTLDRSKTFPSRGGSTGYSSLPIPGALDAPKHKKLSWPLEGGVGGLLGGYAFGVHLSTALALIIPARTASPSLSSKSFIATWIVSSVLTTLLAGRYRYVAYICFGISGGASFSIALSVIIHPSLSPRVILFGIFVGLFTLLSLILATIPRLSIRAFHTFLRVCTASTGAFGVSLSLALLLNPKEESWANVWERLWMKDGEQWGTGRERGLSAAFCVFFVFGIIVDWALKRWIGECPDEKWDSYLAHYATNLPNHADRAGSFQPLQSFWDRVFPAPTASTPFSHPLQKTKPGSKEIIFPEELDSKTHLPLPVVTMHNAGKLSKSSKADSPLLLETRADMLKKPRKKSFGGFRMTDSGRPGGRKPVKFGGNLSSDSDSDDEELIKKGDSSSTASPVIGQKQARPWMLSERPDLRSYSSSAPTLVDGKTGKERTPLSPKESGIDMLATLDYEKEIESVKDKLKRGKGQGKGAGDDEVEYSDYEEDLTALKSKQAQLASEEGWSPAFLQRHHQASSGAVPVPATPSLLKAIDRINVAQRDAFGTGAAGPGPTSPTTGAVKPAGARSKPSSRDVSHAQPKTPARTPSRDRTPLSHAESKHTESSDSSSAQKRERAPRWEEFWREVKTKAEA